MSDFIREVDEDYRRDRAMQFLSKYQVPIAGLVVLIVAAAGGWRFWMDSKVATAEKANARYVAAAQLAKDGKTADAEGAYDALAKDGPAGYAILARMRAAQVLQVQNRTAAADAFDAIASDPSVDPAMADAARFRGAVIRIDSDPKAFEQRYGRFGQNGFAFHAGMNELLALAALKRDDMTAAARYLDTIIADPGAPTGLRSRAQAFRALVAAGAARPMTTQAPPATVTPADGAAAVAPAAPGGATPSAPAAPPATPAKPAAPN